VLMSNTVYKNVDTRARISHYFRETTHAGTTNHATDYDLALFTLRTTNNPCTKDEGAKSQEPTTEQ